MAARKKLVSMLEDVLQKLKKTATEDIEKIDINDDEALKDYIKMGKGAIDTILREAMVQRLKLVNCLVYLVNVKTILILTLVFC